MGASGRHANGEQTAGGLDDWPRRLTAETFGTFALVFVAVGADTMAAVSGGRVSEAARAVAPALMVAALIYAIGDVSGAHLNPVVSLAFALRRLVPVTWLVPYWAAQLAGAVLACVLAPRRCSETPSAPASPRRTSPVARPWPSKPSSPGCSSW